MRIRHICALCVLLFVCGCVPPAFPQTAATQRPEEPKERISFLRDIRVEKGETLREAICVFCSVIVRGELKGEVVVVWGNIEIEGKLEGEAVAAGGQIALRGEGAAEGSIVALGGRVVQSGSGKAKGDVSELPYVYLPGQRGMVFPGTLIFIGCNVLFSMLYLVARRARVEALAETVRKRAVASLVVGAITMTAAMFVFAWATDLEKYDNEAMAAVWIVLTLLVLPGCAGVSLAVGRRVRSAAGIAAAIFGGALILTLLALIPLAGLAVFVMVWILALGATFVGRFGFARAKAVPAQVVSGP